MVGFPNTIKWCSTLHTLPKFSVMPETWEIQFPIGFCLYQSQNSVAASKSNDNGVLSPKRNPHRYVWSFRGELEHLLRIVWVLEFVPCRKTPVGRILPDNGTNILSTNWVFVQNAPQLLESVSSFSHHYCLSLESFHFILFILYHLCIKE
jgi:hypothetical protein